MINVCFLLGNAKGDGGIARVVSIISNELAQFEDLKITIISYSASRIETDYEYNDKIKLVNLFNHDVSMFQAMLKYGAIKKIKKILKKENINILFACGDIFFPLAVLGTYGTTSKCICWEHSDPRGKKDHKFQKQCRKIAVRMADKILVLTKAAEAIYIHDYRASKEKVVQIYNPVSNAAYSFSPYNVESKKIISVGRLSYQKNFQLLINLANIILPKHVDWTWDIYGEGDDRKILEHLIEKNNLVGRVNLKGQVDNLYSVYNQYAFQVMTSRYEGFPMSLLEGAANNLPLVSFDIPTGPSEIIVDGKNGFLVKNGENNTMCMRIEQLIKDSDLRCSMSQEAGKLVHQFKLEYIIQQWRTICKQ